MILLAGDGMAHTIDSAARSFFIYSLARHGQSESLENGITWGITLLIGLLASVANVRSCYHALKDMKNHLASNQDERQPESIPQQSDFWTQFAAVHDIAQGFMNCGYWFASFVNLWTEPNDEILNLSYIAFGVGLAYAILPAAGSAYCHLVLNNTHSHSENTQQTPQIDTPLLTTDTNENAKLNCFQSFMFGGDAAAHVSNNAAQTDFIYQLARNKNGSTLEKGLVFGGTLLFATTQSIAGIRTCYNTLQDANRKKMAPCN